VEEEIFIGEGYNMDRKMRTFIKALRLMERAKNELSRYKELRRKAEYLEKLMNDWEKEMILSLEMEKR